ncbi:MAG: phage tail sheath C-terminal domain-containing protein [Nitrospira sp.]
MPIVQYRSAGVYGEEKDPARAPDQFSPAKMGITGWTQKGPTNYPIQIRSVEDFTRVFGPVNTRGVVPQAIRAFFGTGGERAWVNRIAPADATFASVSIDSTPGPTKWTFTANGQGTWGNDLKIRVSGNRNFLNYTTNSWDKFDVQILAPADFNPAFDDAVETYEAVQFDNPAASDYLLNVIQDPRRPSLLVTTTIGIGGTPSGMLPVTVLSESVGTGGGSPLAQQFQATLANVPVLANTLVLTAVSGSTLHLPTTPSSGAINGTNTDFTLQLTNLPVVEGSTRVFYQASSISNEVLPASAGLINDVNKIFTFNAGVLDNPAHREVTVFRLKYAGAAAAPQTLTTIGGVAATYDLSGAPLASTPVHPGTLAISVNVDGVGLATITDDGAGNLTGSNGSLPLGGTVNYDTGALTGITAALAATSTAVANHSVSSIITKQHVQTLTVSGVGGTFVAGDTITQGGTTGTLLTFVSGVMRVAITAGTAFAAGAITGSGPGTATVDSQYFNNLEQGVPLIGSVDGAGINTIDLVDSQITSYPGSGAIEVTTLVAPIGGTFFYVDYVSLGLVYSNTTGNLLGDVTATSTINADTGLVTMTTTSAPLTGSTIDVLYDSGQFAQDNGLGRIIGDVDPDGTNTIDYNTGAIDVTWVTPPPAATPIIAAYTKLASAVQYQMSGGTDGTVITRNDVSNPTLEDSKAGIYAFDLVEEPLNLVVPDFEGSSFVQADIVDFCDARQDRYAIFAFANGTTVPEAIQYVLVTQAFDTNNAAIYYPNTYFINDSTELPELLPASPFVAGVYAKTARNKNVGKSPAGIVDGALDAPGTVGPEFRLTRLDQDNLYQSRINPIPTDAAGGYRVNGARSLSKTPRWRYVNARLLHIFLMYTTKLQLQWTVFENNGPQLWQKIETALKGYYGSLFRLGYFFGATQDEAFFVKCNANNNSQVTIDQGRVNIDIGFSPNKPAEFVVFTLTQPAGTASTSTLL